MVGQLMQKTSAKSCTPSHIWKMILWTKVQNSIHQTSIKQIQDTVLYNNKLWKETKIISHLNPLSLKMSSVAYSTHVWRTGNMALIRHNKKSGTDNTMFWTQLCHKSCITMCIKKWSRCILENSFSISVTKQTVFAKKQLGISKSSWGMLVGG